MIKQGKMIVVVDDENRENEGDLVCPAITITPEQINFMATYGKGLICVALPPEQIDGLQLDLMSNVRQGDTFGTAFTKSVDARDGISTGISAFDRALTIRLLVDPTTKREQLVIPGHVFPLRAKKEGVLQRPGHTEAAIDLTRLAGLIPGGVICEIMKEDGSMMRFDDLKIFSRTHSLPFISIQDLINYRLRTEINIICKTVLPTPWGLFDYAIYHDVFGQEHILMTLGKYTNQNKPLVRIHSECLTGDIFGSLRCDCGLQLEKSLRMIQAEGSGIVIYLRQEGRGIGLTEKIKAYALQDKGLDTVEANHALGHKADLRSYEVAVKMLHDIGVKRVALLTNNPDKIKYLEQYHIGVERVPLLVDVNEYNMRYQQSKAIQFGHLIPLLNNKNKEINNV